MSVPPAISDLGLVAVSLFLFVSAGWIVMRIIQSLRAQPKNGNGHVPCIQTPQLQAIMTTQQVTMQAVQKIEEGGDEIKDNMLLQTKLMEQMGHVLERLSDFAVKREARFDALESLIKSLGKGKQ